MKKKKIFFVAAHRKNRSPSQRYRFEQYFNAMEENNFTYKLAFLINEKEDNLFYGEGKWLLKAMLLIKYFLKRCWHVFESISYDFIFIQRESFFIGGAFFERLFKLTGKKIIFDFDDAIWLPNVSDGNKKLLFLKSPSKTATIIKIADTVIVGNDFLKSYALRFNQNVKIIPSTIDLNYYSAPEKEETNFVTIGWSGSSTTIHHFKTIENVLIELKKKYGEKIQFIIYGDEKYKNEILKTEGVKWSSESEVSTINQFDIGIMPLPDNQWTQGKCAMKALQYMALAKAVVVSPIGVNKQIIQNGENGFLANDDEWFEKLSALIDDVALRNQIGENAKKTIEESFSTAAQTKNYLSIFC